jgi:hypothetical protein
MTVALAAVSAWGLDEFRERASRYELPVQEAGESDAAYRIEVERYEDAITDAALYVFDRLFLVGAALCALAAVVSLRLRENSDLGKLS